MNKYYTPQIEEFHVGFRYEFKTLIGWDSRICDESHFSSYVNPDGISENIKEGRVRVKYLDQEDIEELGWELHKEELTPDKHQILYFFFHDNRGNVFQLSFSDEYVKIIAKGIDEDSNMILFHGQIKNFDELKKLMKQLNIC